MCENIQLQFNIKTTIIQIKYNFFSCTQIVSISFSQIEPHMMIFHLIHMSIFFKIYLYRYFFKEKLIFSLYASHSWLRSLWLPVFSKFLCINHHCSQVKRPTTLSFLHLQILLYTWIWCVLLLFFKCYFLT